MITTINKEKFQTWKKSLKYGGLKPLQHNEWFMFTLTKYENINHFMKINEIGNMRGIRMIYAGKYIPEILFKKFDEEKMITDNIMNGNIEEHNMHYLYRLIWDR